MEEILNMSTNIVYLQGPAKWSKVFEGNRDMGDYAPEDGQYTIDIGLDAKDTKLVKSWNRMYTGRKYTKDDDNYLAGDEKLTYFQFKRKHKHFKKDGESVVRMWSGAPKVVDNLGDEWPGDLIGNSSIVTVKLDVTTMGSRTYVRLEGVRVEEHVEYEGEEREPPTEDNRSDGLPF